MELLPREPVKLQGEPWPSLALPGGVHLQDLLAVVSLAEDGYGARGRVSQGLRYACFPSPLPC